MKKSITKSTKTAEQAAIELLQKLEHDKIKAAHDKLVPIIQAWEADTGCTFIQAGEFYGGEIRTRLQVIVKK